MRTGKEKNELAVQRGIMNPSQHWAGAREQAKKSGYTGIRAALFADAATGQCAWMKKRNQKAV